MSGQPFIKETSLLLKDELLHATFQLRKTVTRRPIKGKALKIIKKAGKIPKDFKPLKTRKVCRYGVAGDLLYVQERISTDPLIICGKVARWIDCTPEGRENFKWGNKMFMPKKYARLFLRIKSIRAEFAHKISKKDAINEGIEYRIYGLRQHRLYRDYSRNIEKFRDEAFVFSNPIDSFKSLWIKVHGKESWAENPPVWVIDYEIDLNASKPYLWPKEYEPQPAFGGLNMI